MEGIAIIEFEIDLKNLWLAEENKSWFMNFDEMQKGIFVNLDAFAELSEYTS